MHSGPSHLDFIHHPFYYLLLNLVAAGDLSVQTSCLFPRLRTRFLSLKMRVRLSRSASAMTLTIKEVLEWTDGDPLSVVS
jgi:hypothetical protein